MNYDNRPPHVTLPDDDGDDDGMDDGPSCWHDGQADCPVSDRHRSDHRRRPLCSVLILRDALSLEKRKSLNL